MAKKTATKKTEKAEKPGKPEKKTKVAKKTTAAKKAAPKQPTAKKAKGSPTHDQIAAKAYEIWLSKGQPMGQDDANWAEAVKALKG